MKAAFNVSLPPASFSSWYHDDDSVFIDKRSYLRGSLWWKLVRKVVDSGGEGVDTFL